MQMGCMTRRETIETIFTLQQMLEKCKITKIKLCMIFVDLEVRKTNTSSWSGPGVRLFSNFSIQCQADTKFVKTGRSPSTPMFMLGIMVIGKRPLQGEVISALHIKCFSQSTSSKKFRRPSAEHRRNDDLATSVHERLNWTLCN